MSAPLQVLVTDQRGLDIRKLIEAIHLHYRTPEGRPVKIEIGRGIYTDGIPEGALRLVDRT